MALRGTFDGQRYEDIRVLIPKSLRDFYKERGEWDKIVEYRGYEKAECITVRWQHILLQHVWHLVNGHWTMTSYMESHAKDEVS